MTIALILGVQYSCFLCSCFLGCLFIYFLFFPWGCRIPTNMANFYTNLFDPKMGPKQVQQSWFRVNLIFKGYFAPPIFSELKPHHKVLLSAIPRTTHFWHFLLQIIWSILPFNISWILQNSLNLQSKKKATAFNTLKMLSRPVYVYIKFWHLHTWI